MLRFRRRRGFSWRLVGLALGLALAAMVAPVPSSEAHTCTPDPEIGVSGRLLLPSGSGLSAVELPSRSVRQIAVSPVVGSSRVDLQACKLEYSIVSPK